MWSHGLNLTLLFVFLAALSLGSSAQEALPTSSTLTPKEQALQLLDSLEANSNDQATLIDQSVLGLQTALANSDKLKDSLKKTASYSASLEKSLMISQTLNKVVVPIGVAAVITAVLIAVFKK